MTSMKSPRTLALLSVLVLLVGCNKNVNENYNDSPTAPPPSSQGKVTAGVGAITEVATNLNQVCPLTITHKATAYVNGVEVGATWTWSVTNAPNPKSFNYSGDKAVTVFDLPGVYRITATGVVNGQTVVAYTDVVLGGKGCRSSGTPAPNPPAPTPPPSPPPTTPSCAVATGGSLNPNSGSGTPGQTLTVSASFVSTGGAVCGPPHYFSSNPSKVQVHPSSGLVTFIAEGSATICAQPTTTMTSPQTCGTFTTTVATPPPSPSIVSVNVTPDNATCTVGGTASFSVFVDARNGASTEALWSVSNTSIAYIESTSGNSVILRCRETGSITVTARAVADQSKSDSSNLTVNPAALACTMSVTGYGSTGDIVLSNGQTVNATANCGSGKPFWHSSAPSNVEAKGTENVGGWWVGNNATIRCISTGSATVTVQPSISQTTPSASRRVVCQ